MPIFIIMAAAAAATAIGQAIAAGNRAKASQIEDDAVKQWGPEILPKLKEYSDKYLQTGSTGFDSIKEDAGVRGAQQTALDKLMAEYDSGGMGPEANAAFARAKNEADGLASAAAGAGERSAAARGLQGSGLSQAMALQGAQAGAQRAGDMGTQYVADSRARALDALARGAGVASDMRSGDYRLAAGRASAQDAMNQFNANVRMRAAEGNNQNQLDMYRAQADLRSRRALAMTQKARGERDNGDAANAAGNQWASTISNFGGQAGAKWG